MLYYKVLGKKVLLTAHNVNAAERDGKESAMNRWSLKVQYGLVNHIFVHTDKMKEDLVCGYDVAGDKVSIIPFGIYDCVPNTRLTPSEAKRKLGLNESQKTILFFGRILPYKGLSYLVDAFRDLIKEDDSYRLVIAGEPKKETAEYWREIRESIEREKLDDNVLQRIGFIADEEIEVYFKAADALILPYTMIFQSGVLFMAFSFGLPVIATDVGSLRDDIDEGETGYVCRPCDSADLGRAIATYFASDLFKNLAQKRLEIMALARKRNSWDAVSDKTCHVYTKLLAHKERSDESLRLHD
jgi:glycosyltransferase involved in cell wall biosynthesis